MKATAGPLPTGEGWAYEIKWDGMRIVAEVDGGRLRLRSGRGNDATVTFPELAGLADATGGRDAVLDGEVVAFDDAGVPSFSRLQQRMHVADAATAAARAAAVPVVYVVFDLVHFDGHDCWQLPYRDRRRLLRELLDDGPSWRVADDHTDGEALLRAAREHRLEGVMAKRADRPYEPGRRSSTWRKVKVRHRQEFVVGGWQPGTGSRSGTIGSLMLGCHGPDGLRWVGNAGSGLTEAELRRLEVRLAELATDDCPFAERPSGVGVRAPRWVAPEMVVECEYGEWTPEGRLRHPVYLGERVDKAAADVTCDP